MATLKKNVMKRFHSWGQIVWQQHTYWQNMMFDYIKHDVKKFVYKMVSMPDEQVSDHFKEPFLPKTKAPLLETQQKQPYIQQDSSYEWMFLILFDIIYLRYFLQNRTIFFAVRQAFARFCHGFFQVWGKCCSKQFPTQRCISVGIP